MKVSKKVAVKRLTNVLNKGASVLNRANRRFTRALALSDKNGSDGDNLWEANLLIEGWLTDVQSVLVDLFLDTCFDDTYIETDVGSHDIYGELAANQRGSDQLKISYDLNWNSMSNHDLDIELPHVVHTFKWASDKFDKAFFKEFVRDFMSDFAESGFGGEGSPAAIKTAKRHAHRRGFRN